jgi:hypothetical protein
MDEFRWCKSDQGCGAGQLVSNYADLLGFVEYKKQQTIDFYRSLSI